MVHKIVLASQNAGKIKEIQGLLAAHPIEVIPRQNIEEIPETGLTFVENAIIKARQTALESGLSALADDSGLVVPALQGEPGIHSARYAGPTANTQLNIQQLLKNMSHLSGTGRQAWFYCTLVFMQHAHDPCPIIAHGKWSGEILFEPRGGSGFGYDPIFWLPALGKTAAELTLAEKNRLSHRGQALQSLIQQLSEQP